MFVLIVSQAEFSQYGTQLDFLARCIGHGRNWASSKMVNSESRTSACATSIAALFMSANAPRFDAVAANAIVGLH